MSIFISQNELETFAVQFIEARLKALQDDTAHCLTAPGAPFPAILLCFSTIDLLGALAAGNAKPGATTKQSDDYMQRFMNYRPDQSKLLQLIFRHKLVHLAQPKPVVAFESKKVTWLYSLVDTSQHLQLTALPSQHTLSITSSLSVGIDHEFTVSIKQLVKDVIDSVRRQGGYLDLLKTDSTLRQHFDQAIEQIYKP